jgi:hypothetical protein
MSKGETCHAGGNASKSNKMNEESAIAHLKKAESGDRSNIMEMASELSMGDLRSMAKEIGDEIKAAVAGKLPDEDDYLDDEIAAFKKDPWSFFESFESKEEAYRIQGNIQLASDPGFRAWVRSYDTKLSKLPQEQIDREYSEFANRAGFRVDRADAGMGVRFSGRNTGILVDADSRSEAISKARKKKKRGGDKVEEVWALTPAQKAQSDKGNWVRTVGRDERHLASEGRRGQGPKPKAYKNDARQAPKARGKTPGQPCGSGWISAQYKCAPDKAKVAAERLKSPEGKDAKSRFTKRMRKAKGLSMGAREQQMSDRFSKAIESKNSADLTSEFAAEVNKRKGGKQRISELLDKLSDPNKNPDFTPEALSKESYRRAVSKQPGAGDRIKALVATLQEQNAEAKDRSRSGRGRRNKSSRQSDRTKVVNGSTLFKSSDGKYYSIDGLNRWQQHTII